MKITKLLLIPVILFSFSQCGNEWEPGVDPNYKDLLVLEPWNIISRDNQLVEPCENDDQYIFTRENQYYIVLSPNKCFNAQLNTILGTYLYNEKNDYMTYFLDFGIFTSEDTLDILTLTEEELMVKSRKFGSETKYGR